MIYIHTHTHAMSSSCWLIPISIFHYFHQHLVNWDSMDPMALVHVIEELHTAYKAYQVDLLSQYPRLHTIYENIIQAIDEKHIEVYLPPYDKKVSKWGQGQVTLTFVSLTCVVFNFVFYGYAFRKFYSFYTNIDFIVLLIGVTSFGYISCKVCSMVVVCSIW